MSTKWAVVAAAIVLAASGAVLAGDIAVQAPDSTGVRSNYARPPANKAEAIERQNNKEDILRGYTTYSVQEGQAFVAYVYLRWGDLDNVVIANPDQHFRPWDGFLRIDGGAAEVVAKYPSYGNNPSVQHSTSITKLDTVVTQKGPSCVEWRSSSAGSTAGVTVKLTLRAPTAAGVLRAGNFTVPFKIMPLPPAAKTDAKTGAKADAGAKPAPATPAAGAK